MKQGQSLQMPTNIFIKHFESKRTPSAPISNGDITKALKVKSNLKLNKYKMHCLNSEKKDKTKSSVVAHQKS